MILMNIQTVGGILFFFGAEWIVSRKCYHTYNLLRNQVMEINASNPPDSNGFVYFQYNKTKYDLYYDDRTNVSVYGGYIGFQFQYCQWKEVKEENDITNTIFGVPEFVPYTKRVWSKTQLDSSRYFDRNVHNPVDVPDYKSWKMYRDVKIENLTLNASMFWETTPFQYYGLTDEEIDQFAYSPLFNEGFVYIGDGWFYRPYNGQADLESRIERYNDTKRIMDKCEPGDVRAQFQLFAPKKISVVGYKDGDIIRPGLYKDYRYGVVSRYTEDAEGVLYEYVERADTSTYVLWAVPCILVSFWTFLRERAKRVPTIFLAAFVILALRSVIWNGGILDVKIWIPALLAYAPIYMWMMKSTTVNNWFNRA